MGSFQAGADATVVMDAGNAVGIYDERSAQALVAVPGAVWDTGSAPANATYLRDAVRSGFNKVGLYDELADQMVAKVPGGLKAVVTVPNVVGSLYAAAATALVAAGLRVGTITVVNSAEPATEVTAQGVAAGASEVFTPVNLSISEGPHIVPNLVNVLEATGLAALIANDLVAGTRTTNTHATIVAGNIISTNPAAAASVAGGTSVAYVVSTGP